MLHIKHLRPFLAVARLGNVSRASEELRRAPSAVSRSIQELEAWFGVELFERSPRRWLLTDYGRSLRHRVEIAFGELGQACEALCSRFPKAATRLRSAPFFVLAVHERRLELLFAFTERRHISAAAAAVALSQPAVSMALQDLEAGVGVPLFDRTHAGVALTEAGELLVAHAKRALAQLRLATSEISAQKGVIEGQLVVGALPFSRSYLLPKAIGALLRAHPLLQVRTVEASLDALVTSLQLGDVDFLMGALPTETPASGLVLEPLGQQQMAVLARSDHPLATRGSLQLEEALDLPWVLPRQGTPTREALIACLAQQGLMEPQVAVESSDLSIIRGLLLETDMVTAASLQLFAHELGSGMLAALPLALPGTDRLIGILRRTQEHSSPGAQLLIEALRRAWQEDTLRAGAQPSTARTARAG
jgi:LysR family transcriptional regulator of gallate degradation